MSRNKPKQSQKKQQQPPPKSKLPLVIIASVLALALVGGWLLLSSNRSKGTDEQKNGAAQRSAAARSTAFPGADPPRAKGPESAPAMIEEFADYQCPSCGFFNPVLKKLKEDYGDRLRVVFRHMPLQMHRNASLAARAAEAAGMQGRFWEMSDALYEGQKEWSELPNPRPKFAEYAQRLGLDVARFNAEIDSQEIGNRILADMRRANSIGVNSTPTVFLNGYQVTNLTEENLRKEIDQAIVGAGR